MFELHCPITEEMVEPLEAAFCEWAHSSWTLFNERPGSPFFLQGYFQTKEEGDEAYQALRQSFPQLPEAPGYREFDDKEWQEAYKEHIHPWKERDLHWVPAWRREDYPIPSGEVAVYLDAGMAFGTGCHETTRLMARRLLDFRDARGPDELEKLRIIDAGCGSGILSLSAARLGFSQVSGFDLDPVAVEVSQENLLYNGLDSSAVEFRECGLEEGLAGRQADLLMANIQADVLQAHCRILLHGVAPGGVLALSGILREELEKVREHFIWEAGQAGMKCEVHSRIDGEWADLCLCFVPPANFPTT